MNDKQAFSLDSKNTFKWDKTILNVIHRIAEIGSWIGDNNSTIPKTIIENQGEDKTVILENEFETKRE